MKFATGAATHTGLVRANNEDAFLVDTEHQLYAVADVADQHLLRARNHQCGHRRAHAGQLVARGRRGHARRHDQCNDDPFSAACHVSADPTHPW